MDIEPHTQRGDLCRPRPSVGRRVSTVVIAGGPNDSSVVGRDEIEEWIARWRRWLACVGTENASVSVVWVDRTEASDER